MKYKKELSIFLHKNKKLDYILGEIMVNNDCNFNQMLSNKNDRLIYIKIMLTLISELELKNGNVETNGLNFRVTSNLDDIIEKYGGTILLPFNFK